MRSYADQLSWVSSKPMLLTDLTEDNITSDNSRVWSKKYSNQDIIPKKKKQNTQQKKNHQHTQTLHIEYRIHVNVMCVYIYIYYTMYNQSSCKSNQTKY